MSRAAVAGRRIALLRGINVGTAKRVAMADLRAVFEAAGCAEVRTLLNSGNVVYAPPRRSGADDPDRLERAIAARCGVATRVTVLTAEELAGALRAPPLRAVAGDPARLLLMVARDAAAAAVWKPLLAADWAPEALAVRGRFAWLWCAGGVRKSRLWTAANRALGDGGTARNLTTMQKLLDLAGESAISLRTTGRRPRAAPGR